MVATIERSTTDRKSVSLSPKFLAWAQENGYGPTLDIIDVARAAYRQTVVFGKNNTYRTMNDARFQKALAKATAQYERLIQIASERNGAH